MRYQDFIQLMSKYQTARVKTVNIPHSSSPANVPLSFHSLFPDIIDIIEQNFSELSFGQPLISIFGLQPTAFAIESDLPIRKDRVFSESRARNHLTCALYYLPADQIATKERWQNYKTVVIDFTSGTVMNDQYYLQMMAFNSSGGKILGSINKRKLAIAWHYQEK